MRHLPRWVSVWPRNCPVNTTRTNQYISPSTCDPRMQHSIIIKWISVSEMPWKKHIVRDESSSWLLSWLLYQRQTWCRDSHVIKLSRSRHLFFHSINGASAWVVFKSVGVEMTIFLMNSMSIKCESEMSQKEKVSHNECDEEIVWWWINRCEHYRTLPAFYACLP